MAAAALGAAVFAGLLFSTAFPRTQSTIGAAPPAQPVRSADIHKAYGKLPLSFEANHGQVASSVDFLAHGPGYTLTLSATEIVLNLRNTDRESLAIDLVGANRAAAAVRLDQLAGTVNYLVGNDPAQWRTNVPTFARVRYSEVYPGIDAVYYGNQGQLEYDFVVSPGSDPRAITLQFSNAKEIELEAATGDLLVQIGGQTVRQQKPISYQDLEGGRREVTSRYVMKEGGRIGFELGEYDQRVALVIDPVLTYSTYLGGSGSENGYGIAVDSAGNAYVAGVTTSSNFPVAGALQSGLSGSSDIFVTKLNAAGTALVYSTYLGGSANEFISRIAVDASGNAYVTGNTNSTNFPLANAIQANYRGGDADVFVAKLNSAGNALVFSTYLGGTAGDGSTSIALDSANNVYVTGSTTSTDFPTANPLQGALSTESGTVRADVFVTKINAAGTALIYSTFLGGTQSEGANGIAVDSAGNMYIAGLTSSNNFPTVAAYQATYGGVSDAFVAKISASGSSLIYSTYLGGSDTDPASANDGADFAQGVAIDSTGNAYVTGYTSSTNFPRVNALQATHGGSNDAFVTKLDAAGSPVYSTYLGGTAADFGYGVAVDSAGNAHIAGEARSANFPTANAIQATKGSAGIGGDVFITKLNAQGTALVYSTFLGGASTDGGAAIALDASGAAYVTGATSSGSFPTANAFQAALSGTSDAFIAKISDSSSNGVAEKTLANISTRLPVLTGENVLIAGVIVVGNTPKKLIVRAIGPSLAGAGVSGALEDPTLELFQGNTLLAANDDWRESQEQEIIATGVAPTDNREAAIVRTVAPGNYTAVVRGKAGTTGIAVVEGYDLEQRPDSKLANISSRGFVNIGDNVLIAGFISGPNTRVAVRAIGPSLSGAGIQGALQDPMLALVDANGSTVRANDDWKADQQAELEALGLQPSSDRESALIANLNAASYTAVVRGKNDTTGVAVVEVYNLQ